MTAVIDLAYGELQRLIGVALVGCQFIKDQAGLQVDPPNSFEPQGYDEFLVTSAAILKLSASPTAQMLGATPRYVVERTHRLELGAAGPQQADWQAALDNAVTACAPIAAVNPTLGGLCERLFLTVDETDDLPPDGQKAILTFTIRLRSGDPLGRTP